MPDVRILPDKDRLIAFTADYITSVVEATLSTKPVFTIALSGGSTPRPLYECLATAEYAQRITWSKVHVFFGDERCVPPEHPDSSYGMIQDKLLSSVPIPAENIHRLRGEIVPAQAAIEYEQELRRFFGASDTLFDVNLLGMGDDGHTASLFPGTAAIHEREKWVMAHHVEKVKMWRLTLTPPALNAALQVIFLVSGAGKATMLKRVLQGDYQPENYPSQIIKPVHREALWLVDADAGRLL